MSDRKDSELFCKEKRRKSNDREGNCNFNDLNENVEYNIQNKNSLEDINDIFTRELAENDPLWRVRAYIVGFLLADGTIRYKPFEVAAAQKARDKNILEILLKALGGKIEGPNDRGICYYNSYNKELVIKLRQFGMVEAHSKKEIAESLSIPDFIKIIINNQSIVRDFVRGYYDGDGWITGSFKRGDTSFRILGSINFLNDLAELIKNEIPSLSTFITSEKKYYYIVGNEKYQILSKLIVYKKGIGYYNLTPSDLENGEIKLLEHPWLKILHVAGNFNCTKFFNWLYDNNDEFPKFKINSIGICGKRKFEKAFSILGDFIQRKERLAPDWKDMLPEIIMSLKCRFYRVEEILKLTNQKLEFKIKSLKIPHLFEEQKAKNIDKFRERLKFYEFLNGLIGHYRKGNINFYYNKLNPPSEIPNNFCRYIDIVDKSGIKANIKNLIVYLLILKDEFLDFNEIQNKLIAFKIFNKNSLYPKNIKLNLAELFSFNIIIVDDIHKQIEKQKFMINKANLKYFYGKSSNDLKKELDNLFSI